MTNTVPVIILAGGLGTRISEESTTKPKPMVLVGDQPILWHIIKIYAVQGFTNFIIATGYKHEIIDNWVEETSKKKLWGFECSVRTVFTGEDTQTGGRIERILKNESKELFMFTYGDGLANINLRKLLEFHLFHGKIATVTSVRPPARFGYLESRNGNVIHFGEKNLSDTGWINGGFFVINQKVVEYISGDSDSFEISTMKKLVKNNQLMTHQHYGFWQPMDTLREREILDKASHSFPIPWLEISEKK
jgi:glucose-1-phosphate cytidylyltransferase